MEEYRQQLWEPSHQHIYSSFGTSSYPFTEAIVSCQTILSHVHRIYRGRREQLKTNVKAENS